MLYVGKLYPRRSLSTGSHSFSRLTATISASSTQAMQTSSLALPGAHLCRSIFLQIDAHATSARIRCAEAPDISSLLLPKRA